MNRMSVVASLLLILSLASTAVAAGPGSAAGPSAPTDSYSEPGGAPSDQNTKADGRRPESAGAPEAPGRPAEPGAKAREVLTDLAERLAEQLPEQSRAVEALELSLKAMAGELVDEGAAEDEEEAEEQIAAVVEEKRAAGKADRRELDLLSFVQQKKGRLAEAEATLQDRVAVAPADLEGYRALGTLRKELGIHKGIEAFVGGKEVAFDVRPVIQDGRTLVPVRALTEALGAQVSWDQETWTATIRAGGKELALTINSKTALVNGVPHTLDVPAALIDGRTVLPLRFVAEALGLTVGWEHETQTIVITE